MLFRSDLEILFFFSFFNKKVFFQTARKTLLLQIVRNKVPKVFARIFLFPLAMSWKQSLSPKYLEKHQLHDLQYKILSCGLSTKFFQWSFHYNHCKCALINDESLSTHEISAGIPEGSVLTPTLLRHEINSLHFATSYPIHSFANHGTKSLQNSFCSDYQTSKNPSLARVRTRSSLLIDPFTVQLQKPRTAVFYL